MTTAREPAPANGTMPPAPEFLSMAADIYHSLWEDNGTHSVDYIVWTFARKLQDAERSGWERGREAAARFVELPESFLIDGKGASKAELAMGIRMLQPEVAP